MSRELLAYLLLAVLVAAAIATFIKVRSNSFERTYIRSIRRDATARAKGRRR